MAPPKRASYWLAWGMVWGFIFGTAFAIFLFFGWKWEAPALCAADTKGNCFREWVSALGAWIAVVVAVPTIILLRQQNRISEQSHRRNLLFEYAKRYEVAKGVRQLTTEIDKHLSRASEDVDAQAEGIEEQLLSFLNELRETYDNPIFDSFDGDFVWHSRRTLRTLREALSYVPRDPETVTNTLRHHPENLLEVFDDIKNFNAGIQRTAAEFIKFYGDLGEP